MHKRDVIGLALGVILALLYAIDALRHGWGFLWHLPLLCVFAAPALNDAVYGLPLAAYERQGTREYYTRYAGLSPEAADVRIADARRFARDLLAAVVAIVELLIVLAAPGRYGAIPSIIMWFFFGLGAVCLGVLIFGIAFAMWRVRQ